MSTEKRKNVEWSLRELVVKIAVMIITVSIGLWCGYHDSYGSFYMAVFVQAVNNLYDSAMFLGGYNKFITVFHVLSFGGALISLIFAIVHCTINGSAVDTTGHVYFAVAALSLPVLHFIIEVYFIIRQGRF